MYTLEKKNGPPWRPWSRASSLATSVSIHKKLFLDVFLCYETTINILILFTSMNGNSVGKVMKVETEIMQEEDYIAS